MAAAEVMSRNEQLPRQQDLSAARQVSEHGAAAKRLACGICACSFGSERCGFERSSVTLATQIVGQDLVRLVEHEQNDVDVVA